MPVPAIPSPSAASTALSPPSRPRQPIAFHPLLFALFPLLSLYAANVGLVPWTDTVRAVGGVLAATVLLWGMVRLCLRGPAAPGKAAALVSVIVLFFFSYGHLYSTFGLKEWVAAELLIYLTESARQINPHLYLMPLYLLVFALCAGAILRSRRGFTPFTALLNVVGIALVAGPIWTISTSRSRYPGFAPVFHRAAATKPSVNAPVGTMPAAPKGSFLPATAASPDIYYIILDAYGRQDVLKRYYGWNNEPFLRALERRGFFVARQGRANYAQTICSVTASLNMNYLDGLSARMGPDSTDIRPLSEAIDHNAVSAFLRKRDYRIISISTGFGPTATPSADLVLGGGGDKNTHNTELNPYEGLLLDITPLLLLPRARETLYDQHRRALLAGFAHLSELPRLPGRKFVFAHLLAPHPPFVFDADGNTVEPGDNRPFSLADGSDFFRRGDRAEYRHAYIQQLRWTNRKTLEAIDALRTQSATPPIIIVQGDHGPRMFLSWKSLARSDVREAFANLNAYSLPDGQAAKVFRSDISPVNSFRLLFDHYFDAGLPPLPDRSFYSNPDRQYQFTDVTKATALE